MSACRFSESFDLRSGRRRVANPGLLCRRSRAEAKAKRHLVNQGFEVYLPIYRQSVRHA
jgi:hypothetical protein